MNKKILLSYGLFVLTATVTQVPIPAFAADPVANSCGILIDTVKARAETQLDALLASMKLKEFKSRYDYDAMGCASLSDMVQNALPSLPEKDRELANDLDAMTKQLDQFHREFDDASTKLSLTAQVIAKAPKWTPKKKLDAMRADYDALAAKKHPIELKIDDLNAVIQQSSGRLRADVRAFGEAKLGLGARGFNSANDPKSYMFCSGSFAIPEHEHFVSCCATINVATSTVSYSVELDGNREYSPATSSIRLGDENPAAAVKHPAAVANIRSVLVSRQLVTLPKLCQEIAKKNFAGATVTDSSTAKVAPASAPSQAMAMRGTNSGKTELK